MTYEIKTIELSKEELETVSGGGNAVEFASQAPSGAVNRLDSSTPKLRDQPGGGHGLYFKIDHH
jgi:bacteriocin-like protein